MLRTIFAPTGPRREAGKALDKELDAAVEKNVSALRARNMAVKRLLTTVVLTLEKGERNGNDSKAH